MSYSSHYQQQTYDPSSLTQQIYDQPANDYYTYSYPNPQYTSVQSYSYPNLTVQPSQHEQQEPYPPGVTVPPLHQDQSSYFQYHTHSAAAGVLPVGPQHRGVDSGVGIVHQPKCIVTKSWEDLAIQYMHMSHPFLYFLVPSKIVQSSYGGFSIVNGVAPPRATQTHLSPQPNVRGRSYRVRCRGRGHVIHKHVATRGQERTTSTEGGSHIQGESLPPMAEPYVSSFGPISTTIHGQTHIMPALPPPRLAWCELCRVDCNTLDILEQHKNGKKHKKKLKVFEELQNLNSRVIGKQMEQTSSSQLKPEVPPQADQIKQFEKQIQQESLPSQAINEESKVAVENRELEEAKPTEEIGKKVIDHSEGLTRGLKRKMRGGKVGRRMKPCDQPKRTVEPPKPKEVIPLVCELCNVKCESLIVFQSHLAGKKHKSKAKRFLGQEETLGQEVLPALRPANQDSNASTFVAFHHQGLCNEKIVDVQASTVETNVESTKLEATVSQPQMLVANFGDKILVNIEGISEEGHPQGGAQCNCPAGGLVTEQVEGVAMTGMSKPVTSQTALNGVSV
ncbi:hypothetical protein Sango_1580400 [Sesamum angolense]|uniref:U1-type domain-containing protein n=1 Tax=Sesamum angolense TaxID=2727404 RepID=A0AAE1WQL1_9LAMI|nr:hypothetical protein Sango_1580400 [Sesamum angolense]